MSLQFSDTTNKNGILQECESWIFGSDYGAITDNAERLATFTRNVNIAVDEVIVDIMKQDERWQFDDTNHTDYPIGTTTLVDGQQDYVFDVTHIKITGVDVLDASGVYQPMKPTDIDTIRNFGKGESLTAYESADGMPEYYDVTATSIFLYPAPAAGSVTVASGLKVYFQRAGVAFVTTDTTAIPGFPSLFHQIVPIKASNRFAKQNSMQDKARELDAIEQKLQGDITEWYSNRNITHSPRLSANVEDTR